MKAVYKWRLENGVYGYITNEQDESAFIYNQTTFEREYPDGTVISGTSVDEPLIANIVSKKSKSEYIQMFNEFKEFVNVEYPHVAFLDVMYYYNVENDECSASAGTLKCAGSDILFKVKDVTSGFQPQVTIEAINSDPEMGDLRYDMSFVLPISFVSGDTPTFDSVVAGAFIKSGGTGEQYLMADGSVSVLSAGRNVTITTATTSYGKVVTINSKDTNTWRNIKVDNTQILDNSTASGLTLSGGTNVTLAISDSGNNKVVTINADGTNTWRPIQVNGENFLTDNATTLNLSAGTNVTLTTSPDGTIIISDEGDNEDKKVMQSSGNTDETYPILASDQKTSEIKSGSCEMAIYDTGININPFKHSVAEGHGTTALGSCSHAEGYSISDITVVKIGRMNNYMTDYARVKTGTKFEFKFQNECHNDENYLIPENTTGYLYLYEDTTCSNPIARITSISDTLPSYQSNHRVRFFNVDNEENIPSVGNGAGITLYRYKPIESLTNGNASHTEGENTLTESDNSHAEGGFTIASGVCSHSEGSLTSACGECSHSEGYETWSIGKNSHSEGYFTVASGVCSHSEGRATKAIGDYSHSEGIGTKAATGGTHSEGYALKNTDAVTSSEGTVIYYEAAISSEGLGSHSEGYAYLTNNKQDSKITAACDGSHAEGFCVDGNITSSGLGSHAEGCASGSTIEAKNNGAHAEGATTQKNKSIIASGIGSHAEGNADTGDIKAIGRGAHAEGDATIASGICSHAEGNGTNAIGNYSHAEGLSIPLIKSNKSWSGSMGYDTLTEAVGTGERNKYEIGDYIMLIDEDIPFKKITGVNFTTTTNEITLDTSLSRDHNNHTEQDNHIYKITGGALKDGSHVSGENTIALGKNQTVIGQYNIPDSDALFIVGNGASNGDRSNAFEVYDQNNYGLVGIIDSVHSPGVEFYYNGFGQTGINITKKSHIIKDITFNGTTYKNCYVYIFYGPCIGYDMNVFMSESTSLQNGNYVCLVNRTDVTNYSSAGGRLDFHYTPAGGGNELHQHTLDFGYFKIIKIDNFYDCTSPVYKYYGGSEEYVKIWDLLYANIMAEGKISACDDIKNLIK